MRRRPWILVCLAILHLLAPIGNIIFNALWASYPLVAYMKISLAPSFIAKSWIEWTAPIIAGFAIYMCKKWSFLLYLLCMFALFFVSLRGYYQRPFPLILLELILVFVFNISIVAYFLLPAVREVYFNPRLRWWERQARFTAEWPAEFSDGASFFAGVIRNISNSGLFFSSDHTPNDKSSVKIKFSFDGEDYLLEGPVILHGMQNRLGFGVRFQHTGQSLKSVQKLTKKLLAAGKLIAEQQPDKNDSFASWIFNLLTHGKGIIPNQRRRD